MSILFLASAGYDLYGGGTGVSVGGRGTVELEPLVWQLIAVPIQYGFWRTDLHQHEHDGVTVAKFKNYILDQIEDLYGAGKIEVANTYLGDVQAFYSFVPGVTPENSPHNFQLVYTDNDSEEISGFWVKSLHTDVILLSWGE